VFLASAFTLKRFPPSKREPGVAILGLVSAAFSLILISVFGFSHLLVLILLAIVLLVFSLINKTLNLFPRPPSVFAPAWVAFMCVLCVALSLIFGRHTSLLIGFVPVIALSLYAYRPRSRTIHHPIKRWLYLFGVTVATSIILSWSMSISVI
jgi:hypothetical protein